VNNEGYVKYRCERIDRPLAPFDYFAELNQCRTHLHELGLVGVYPDGIGYGNVSVREGATQRFYISGSATGEIHTLDLHHYAHVTEFDMTRNWVKCEGSIQASSESMTHAAVYVALAEACTVLHVHHLGLWNQLLGNVPTTAAEVEYGTPEMAAEIGRLFRETDVAERRIIAMAGHREGLITFGVSVREAMDALLTWFD